MAAQEDQPVQLRGALFGVNREDVSNLQALLEQTRQELADRVKLAGRELARAEDLEDLLARTQSGLGQVQQELAETLMRTEFAERRAELLQQRMASATHDSTVLAEDLDDAIVTLAGLVLERDDRDSDVLRQALLSLLPNRVQSVWMTTVDQLDDGVRDYLLATESHRATWSAIGEDGPGGSPLSATAALAGDRAVMVTYAPDVYDDGAGFSKVVESLAHAVASSLQARALAREHAALRYPVSLLGDLTAARSFVALRVAQGETIVQVDVPLDFSTGEALTGVWGEPAWHATYFDLAVRLDKLARAVGGEAFESDQAFHPLVPAAEAEGVRTAAQEILDDLGLPGPVTSP